jgi:pimeloyl-ACP methyl ester carboxylesterase
MTAPHTILLHGALGDGRQLTPLAERLAATGGQRVTALELPGHGTTPLTDGSFGIEGFAHAVLDTLDQLGIAEADFFGYSMGGYVALYLAARAPTRVRRVATLATKLAWTPNVAARESALLDATTIRAKVPKFATALEQRHTAIGWESVLDRTSGLLRELGERPLLTSAVLSSIVQPVRIGVGDRDATVSIAESADAVTVLPQGELEVHPRTLHPFEKAPLDRLTRSLVDFFA